MSKLILCATDGTANAEKAVSFASGLAKSLGAGVVFVAVRPYTLGRGGPVPLWDEQRAQEALVMASKSAEAAGAGKVEIIQAEGADISDAILTVAETKHADHIVVGSGSKNALQRTLIGSVSTALVNKSHVPVTVVH
jgi:nucleotide-binding universal stress UspA family protein